MLSLGSLNYSVACAMDSSGGSSYPDFSRATILVVDDAPDGLLLLERMLVLTRAKVVTASDAPTAVRKAIEEKVDAVVMDVRMPGMSGDQGAQQLRAQGFMAPIIALTGNADPEERITSLKAGFSDYLVKPVSRQRLYEALQAAGL